MRLAPSLFGAAIAWRAANRQNGNRRTAAVFDERENAMEAAVPKQQRCPAHAKWGPALLPAPICAERRICRCSLAWLPEGPPLFDPGSPAQASLPIVVQPEGWFSIFCGPSWADPFRVACSQGEPRTATGRPTLPAPLPVVRLGPKPSSSPSGGDRSFRHLPRLLAVAGLPMRRELPSRSPM